MSIGLWVVLIVLFVIAMIATFYAINQEEDKMKKYRAENGDTIQAEMARSQEYEENSVKKFIPIQLWMYLIATILSIGLVVFYAIN